MYEPHPAAAVFPMMTDEELDALGADMLEHGQREPIILYHGQILDGRNRYRACILTGIEPRFREELPPDPYAFVATANLHRRHLSEEQRGIIAARLATMRQGARTDLSPNGEMISQAKAAQLLKVSKRRVERSHELIEKGVPDLVDAVERREVKVSAAAEFAKATPPLDQARLIAEHGSPAAAVKATVKAKADRAASKMPRKVPDPKPAADRAEARARLDTARAAYVATVEAAQLTVTQRTNEIRTVVRQLYTDGLPDFQLLLGSSDGGKLN
jgi:ParB-like chromosome segregation protein Spo0J